jgi:hypothetical protein
VTVAAGLLSRSVRDLPAAPRAAPDATRAGQTGTPASSG